MMYPKSNRDELRAALVQAAGGCPEWARALLAEGADQSGMLLIMAVECAEPEIVRMLVDAGADVNRDFRDTTPLVHAVRGAHSEVVNVLLQAGADPEKRTSDGTSPSELARGAMRTSSTPEEWAVIVRLLVEAGARG